ncbi:putative membrane protein YphA (DoxX/SURF4 family) [Actinomycetospora succinea]|uniref:Putative membrane protein YphA (DoxX/SURF4 family) n=1 Tax=Actinomycetospora succinea TaxID=663603 RepID=A0A4R6UU57_9PSEU|nr:DoxX family protein [Actinomycetospora succinea]TDQ50898.1 putative membrane protein YphA (DoxX/SURF4 family) [Actinomycetospora succinea]
MAQDRDVARDRPRGPVERFLGTRVHGRTAVATAALRIVTGLAFVLFSLPKFLLHEDELGEFVRFGLPDSSVLVYLVGALELGAGLMLVLGVGTRLAALGMALNMAGAIATAGVQVGGPIHLGVAPALLVSTVYLLWAGSGAAAIDRTIGGVRPPA